MSTPTVELRDMPIPALLSSAERRSINLENEIAELERRLELARNVEASLRRELETERAGTARWSQRIKTLEARLEHIANIAGGHAIVEEVEVEPDGEQTPKRLTLDDPCTGDVFGKHLMVSALEGTEPYCSDCGARRPGP